MSADTTDLEEMRAIHNRYITDPKVLAAIVDSLRSVLGRLRDASLVADDMRREEGPADGEADDLADHLRVARQRLETAVHELEPFPETAAEEQPQ